VHKNNKGQRWFIGLVYATILLIFVFLAQRILANWSQVLKIGITFQPGFLSLSILLLISYFFSLALLWNLITGKVGLKLPFRKTAYYWFISQLGKYVPGKIVFMMSRAYFYKKEGFRVSLTASAFLLEAVAVATSISLFSVILITHYVAKEFLYLIPILVMSLLFFHPKMVGLIVSLFNQVLGRQAIALRVGMKDWLSCNFLYGLNFFYWLEELFSFFVNRYLISMETRHFF
jgi:hypothetical protein